VESLETRVNLLVARFDLFEYVSKIVETHTVAVLRHMRDVDGKKTEKPPAHIVVEMPPDALQGRPPLASVVVDKQAPKAKPASCNKSPKRISKQPPSSKPTNIRYRGPAHSYYNASDARNASDLACGVNASISARISSNSFINAPTAVPSSARRRSHNTRTCSAATGVRGETNYPDGCESRYAVSVKDTRQNPRM